MKKIKQMVAAIICAFVATANAADWTMTVPENMTNGAITVISDGNWKINVYVVDAETRELGLGKGSGKASLFVYDENNKQIGSGDLDLRKPIYKAGGENRWTITCLGKQLFADKGTNIRNFYLPEEVTDFGVNAFASTWKSISGVLSIVSTNSRLFRQTV